MISIGLSEKKDIYLFDSAVLIDYTGEILLKHRKINLLTTLMDPLYTPGDKVSVITTRFGRIGMLICADTFKNKILRQIRQKKPDILIIPYGWAEKQENWPEHGKLLKQLVKDVAKKVKTFVIGTDLIGEISSGPWKGRIYGGQSVIADKKGKILAIGKDREPDILIKEISLETNYF